MATQRGRAGRSGGVLSLTRAGGGGNVGQNRVHAHTHTPTAGLGGSRELSLPTLSFLSYAQTTSAALLKQSQEPSLYFHTVHAHIDSLRNVSFTQLSFMPEKLNPALVDSTKYTCSPMAMLRAKWGTRLTHPFSFLADGLSHTFPIICSKYFRNALSRSLSLSGCQTGWSLRLQIFLANVDGIWS